jgi:hypothetical protein
MVSSVSDDEVGGLLANIAASGASNRTQRAQRAEQSNLGRLGPCPGPSRL